jgi:hypothetical protein
MNGVDVISRNSILGSALAAGFGAVSSLAGAQASTPPKTFLVTSITASAAGNVVQHEVLSLQDAGGASRIAVASPDGSVLSLPVTFTSEGEIASSSRDSSVTCFNMAMGVLARIRQPGDELPAVLLRFGASVVQVPLAVRSTETRGGVRTTALAGTSTGIFTTGDTAVDAGIVVNASIESSGDALRGATFDEVHYAGRPAHAIARSSCVLTRAPQPASART